MLNRLYEFFRSLGQRMPRKYKATYDAAFQAQLHDLSSPEKQQLVQHALRQANRNMQDQDIELAQVNIVFAVTTAVDNKIEINETEYDLDTMVRMCWLDSKSNTSRQVKQNRELLRKAGFQVKNGEKYEKLKTASGVKKKKGGFLSCFGCFD